MSKASKQREETNKVDSTHAKDKKDLRLYLLESFHGNGAPWSLYTRAGRFALGDPLPKQSNKTNYWEASEKGSHLVPGMALWAPSRAIRQAGAERKSVCHSAGSEAKVRVEDAQKYWQYGLRLIRCRLLID